MEAVRALTGRVTDLWRSSKLFGAAVMLAVVIPAALSSTAFSVLMVTLGFALVYELARTYASSECWQVKIEETMIAGLVLVNGMVSLIIVRQSELGVLTLLLLAAGTFLNDAGAQMVGKLCAKRLRVFGQTSLVEEVNDPANVGLSLLHLVRWCARGLAGQPFKRISPGKTWVGLVGGLAIGWLAGAGVLWWLYATWDYPLAYGIALVVVTPPLAVCGDAIESAAKRSLGIKDMSSVLGAHGGLADRLDAIAATAIGAAVLQLLLF